METRTSGSVRGMKKLTCSQAERFIPTLPSLERANPALMAPSVCGKRTRSPCRRQPNGRSFASGPFMG